VEPLRLCPLALHAAQKGLVRQRTLQVAGDVDLSDLEGVEDID
jgi:hypothetical protein